MPQMQVEEQLADVIQNNIVAVTIIKSRIIRTMSGRGSIDDIVVDNYRNELKDFYQALPPELAIGYVFNIDRSAPSRANIFYLHLFYLSAMQLLYRRVLLDTNQSKQCDSAKAAIKEGLMASRMAARVLSLMQLEGAIVQICWLCMYASLFKKSSIVHRASES